jgi:hypothetical protein
MGNTYEKLTTISDAINIIKFVNVITKPTNVEQKRVQCTIICDYENLGLLQTLQKLLLECEANPLRQRTVSNCLQELLNPCWGHYEDWGENYDAIDGPWHSHKMDCEKCMQNK